MAFREARLRDLQTVACCTVTVAEREGEKEGEREEKDYERSRECARDQHYKKA